MHAAFDRVDVVRERKYCLAVTVGPLHRRFNGDAFALAVGRDDRMDRILFVVEMLDEGNDAALVHEDAFFDRIDAFVAQRDLEAAIEKSQFAQAFLQDVPMEVERFEDAAIGEEPLQRSGPFGLSDRLELLDRLPTLELDLPDLSIAFYASDHSLGKGVDDRDADPVQATRDFVAAFTELAARVQHRHHDLDGRHSLLRHHVDRDAAPVVFDRARAVLMKDDAEMLGVAG